MTGDRDMLYLDLAREQAIRSAGRVHRERRVELSLCLEPVCGLPLPEERGVGAGGGVMTIDSRASEGNRNAKKPPGVLAHPPSSVGRVELCLEPVWGTAGSETRESKTAWGGRPPGGPVAADGRGGGPGAGPARWRFRGDRSPPTLSFGAIRQKHLKTA